MHKYSPLNLTGHLACFFWKKTYLPYLGEYLCTALYDTWTFIHHTCSLSWFRTLIQIFFKLSSDNFPSLPVQIRHPPSTLSFLHCPPYLPRIPYHPWSSLPKTPHVCSGDCKTLASREANQLENPNSTSPKHHSRQRENSVQWQCSTLSNMKSRALMFERMVSSIFQ